MLHALPSIGIFAQLAVAPAAVPSAVPFDTTIAAPTSSGVALNLESGGKVRILGGDFDLAEEAMHEAGTRKSFACR